MMKIIKVIQTIIIILSIVLVAYWMWMRTPDDKNIKLSKICGQIDLSKCTITAENKEHNCKFNFSIKSNLDYYVEFDNNQLYHKTIVIGNDEYHIHHSELDKTIYKKDAENKITESVSSFLNRALCYKRAFDIVDGKIYYVEYFYNINVLTETRYPNSVISKIYYKNDKIAFIEEGYEGDDDFDRYYITSFSNTINDSNFEIPTDYKWIDPEQNSSVLH